MGFFKSIMDSLKLSDDSDYDDYDDYDDYLAAEEEKKRLKEQKEAEKKAAPRKSLRDLLPKKEPKQPVQQEYTEDDMEGNEIAMPSAQQRSAYQQPAKQPLYDNNTVSIQERRTGYSSGSTTFSDRYKAKEAAMYRQQQPARAANHQTAPFTSLGAQQPQAPRESIGVRILKPQNFNDAMEICDNLINGNPIIVNLEGFDTNQSQRLMDFISGCVYSIGANFHQISGYVFIVSPADVDISGDYNALMSQNGYGFSPSNKR